MLLLVAVPTLGAGASRDAGECFAPDDDLGAASLASAEPRTSARSVTPLTSACGEPASADHLAAPPSDAAARVDPRGDLGTTKSPPPVVAFAAYPPVPVGVPFLVGGTFASIFTFARARLGRPCDGCVGAELRGKEIAQPTETGWRYLVGGIQVAALVGAVVLVAAVEGTPNSGPPGKARLDTLRLVVAPTNGGAAVSLSGAF